jgi:hypothetical protein
MKKDIPLEIWELMQPLVDSNKNLITQIPDAECLFLAKDHDPNSDFFFKIIKTEQKTGRNGYYIEYKPGSKSHLSPLAVWQPIENIGNDFNAWIGLISIYDSINTIFDDPILKKYQEEFLEKFKLLDMDADIVGFNLEKQQVIDNYLVNSIKILDQRVLHAPQGETEQYVALQNEAMQIKHNITKQTKNQVMISLAKFWGNVRIVGLPLLKEILLNVASELTVKLLS